MASTWGGLFFRQRLLSSVILVFFFTRRSVHYRFVVNTHCVDALLCSCLAPALD